MKISVGKIQKKGLKLGSVKKPGKLKKTGLFADDAVEESEKVVRIDSYDAEKEKEIKKEEERQKNGDYLVIIPPKNRTLLGAKKGGVIEKDGEEKQVEEKDEEENLEFGMNVLQGKERESRQDAETRMVGSVPMDIGENPTSESYEQMPVENFGLAFLRGLGYDEKKEKKSTESSKDSVTRRALFLGIGAKENTDLAFKGREMKYEGLLLRKKGSVNK